MESSIGDLTDCIFSPVHLPCGRWIQNRLVKVAMYEHLARFFGGPPNPYHYALYSAWSKGGWGMIITGNVQVSHTHLTLGRDIIIPHIISEDSLLPFKHWIDAIHGEDRDVLAVMQLSHAGRQSVNFIGGRAPFSAPIAPSSVRVQPKNAGRLSDALHALAFQTPLEVTVADIEEIVEAFVRGAKVAHLSGFDGVEVHAAHGYLIAQFISPKSNRRTDEYSSSVDNALRLLYRVLSSIRNVVPKTFIVGLKMNAADYVTGKDDENGLQDEQRVLDHVRSIARWGLIDFIEVSGGDYENPEFSSTGSSRQALFSRFSRVTLKTLRSLDDSTTLKYPPPLVLLTGGLRSLKLLHKAISDEHANLLGVGRASVLCPDLPSRIRKVKAWSLDDMLKPFHRDPDLRVPPFVSKMFPFIPLVGAGINMSWYGVMMRRLATSFSVTKEITNGLEPGYGVGPLEAMVRFWIWTNDFNFFHWCGLVYIFAAFPVTAGLLLKLW